MDVDSCIFSFEVPALRYVETSFHSPLLSLNIAQRWPLSSFPVILTL